MNFREVRSKSLALEAVSCIPPDEQVPELPLLGVAVKRHGGHAVSAAVGGALASSEGGAAEPPGHQELLASEGVIRSTVATPSPSSSTSSSDGLWIGFTNCT